MTLTEKIVDKVRSVFRPRDAIVSDIATLEALIAAADAKRLKDRAPLQAEVDAIREPERRLQRFDAEALSASNRSARELAVLERELREHPDLARFTTLLDRLFDIMRATPVPSAHHVVNEISGTTKTTNLDEITRHLAVGQVLSRQRVELRDRLWRLPSNALSARLGELRAELEEAVRETVFEKEVS